MVLNIAHLFKDHIMTKWLHDIFRFFYSFLSESTGLVSAALMV